MQQEESKTSDDFRQAVNLTFLIANTHAVCITPFIRHSFGSNVPGICGFFACILMFITAAFSGDPRMLGYLAAWLCMMFFQRIYAGIKRRRGWQIHSYCSGWPWLGRLIPFCRTEYQAKNIEPVLCLMIGLALGPWSPAIGLFVMGGVISLTIVHAMQSEIRKRRVSAMQDLQIEQRALSERLRGVRQDF